MNTFLKSFVISRQGNRNRLLDCKAEVLTTGTTKPSHFYFSTPKNKNPENNVLHYIDLIAR